ncbi:hypothetical protein [Raoultibacter phocaeensis]|uniref:hypothetical protein n=1 Tax=Raoultibacter phocaeensis TaxID=2479841 RepID=UPI0021044BD9|nr:hypothetical protein [Raoultibacter phocaeensis]
MLRPASYSFAASETVSGEDLTSSETVSEKAPEPAEFGGPFAAPTAPADDVDNVVVGTTPTDPATPNPADPPAEPSVPEYEKAWFIGADEPSTVVAELWVDGTFVVDGAGAVRSFDNAGDVPWLAAGVAEDIERVIFADKVEAESLAHWFEGCSNLSEIANVPATTKDLTRTFYECPNLVELPDELAFADDAILEECFGFAEPSEEPLVTIYRGANKNVLSYAWEADGRVLVNPDAPQPPLVDQPEDPEASTEESEGEQAGESAGEFENEPADGLEGESTGGSQDEPANDPANKPLGEQASDPAEDTASEPNEVPSVDDAEPNPATSAGEAVNEPDPAAPAEQAVPEPDLDSESASSEEQAAQISITIPSSVSMTLGEGGPNAATIPVMAANHSDRVVALTGARLKRADMDMSGGVWALTTEDGATTFVQNARFTPLGLEVSFDQPVVLAAGDGGTQLVWHGTFTDYGMKKLLNAVVAAGDAGFTYGSMIWIVSAVS